MRTSHHNIVNMGHRFSTIRIRPIINSIRHNNRRFQASTLTLPHLNSNRTGAANITTTGPQVLLRTSVTSSRTLVRHRRFRRPFIIQRRTYTPSLNKLGQRLRRLSDGHQNIMRHNSAISVHLTRTLSSSININTQRNSSSIGHA